MFFPVYISNDDKWYISIEDDKDTIEILSAFGSFNSYEETKKAIEKLEQAWQDVYEC